MTNTKLRRTIATTLMISTLIGCAGITSGCYKKAYTLAEYEELESVGKKYAEEYFEDELGYVVNYCSPYVFTGKYRQRYLTNYVQGTYNVDEDSVYLFSINVDTGEIFTAEHYKEFEEIAIDYFEDEFNIEISDMRLSLSYEISDSEYVPKKLPQDLIYMQEFPVDMDADDFEKYLKNPDNRDTIYMGIVGTAGEDFDLADFDEEYFEDIEDEYNVEFDFTLKNDYEYFKGTSDYFFYEHFIMVEKDDFTFLVTDKTYSYTKIDDRHRNFDYTEEEVIDNLVIEETKEGYKISSKDKNGAIRFKIVVDDEDTVVTEIVNAKRGVERQLKWEAIDDGLYACEDSFTFNRVFRLD